jgi:hypothetical protein
MHPPSESETSYRLAVTAIGEDRDAAVEILRQTLGMNAIDARTRTAHVPGIWLEEFPAEAAQLAALQLREQGGTAAAIPAAAVPDLRSARTLHHIRCQDEGLVIISIAGDPEQTIPWENVGLLSVADVAGLREQVAGGLPNGVFRHDPGIVESHHRHHGLELWLITRSPVSGYRIDAELMNYEYLGDRRSPSTEANFAHLVEDIRRSAPRLVQTPSALEYDPASSRSLQQMDSPAAHRDAVAAHWAVVHAQQVETEPSPPSSRRLPSPTTRSSSTTSRRAESNRMLDSHRRLHADIETLWTCRSRRRDDDAAWRAELAQGLGQLQTTLDEHFRLEEEGGYLREVLEIAPRYATVAESLRRQHDSLHDQIRSIHPRSDTADELVEDIDRFLRALEIHEHAENAVVQSAFEDDLAAGD